ncbi:hepatocyte growth factor receptor-like [Asterias rubens]|uniref:hepatocyte growth factor receptor-like n=1 Tax=Asterias rubens TaxID=7604 RepID=UPI0014559CC0|nr:hepatocyte growth factor receptor-like [Asterias rubens]
MISSVTETSISLSWSHPMQPNGNMLTYKIEYRVVSKPYDSSFTFDQAGLFETKDVSDLSDLSGTVMNLEPSTEYELQVYGINEADITGDKASIRLFTAIKTDLPPPEKPSLIGEKSTSSSIAIRLVATATSKYITAYQIGVQMTITVSRRSAPAFGHYRDNPSAYIAAELDDGLPEIFVVGDNKEYGSYWNPPLQEGAVYKIYVGAVSRINETEANAVWNEDPLTAEAKLPSTTPSTLIIVICVVIAAIVILVGVICYTRRRRKQKRRNPLQHQGINAGHELVSYENAVPRDEKPTTAPIPKEVSLVQESVYEPVGPGSSAHGGALPAPPPAPPPAPAPAPAPSPAPVPAPAPAPESQPTYEDVGLPTWANPWSILWEDLFIGNKVIGKGHFGEVRDGVVKVKGDLCRAAIKKLKESATYIDRDNFLEELKTMTLHGSHPNLVKILGACQHEGILYVAMEYLSNGDLRCYLRKARSMEDDGQASLSPQKLLQFALDVAKGMQHLAAYGVIHRDLAARNILLDDNLVAKVSDFGLSRGEDVYVQTSKTRVPTRWLSLESLTHQTYTSKSDVWSFGILLWEIATLGGTPYPGIKTQSLTSRLENGYRMPKPDNSDDKIYEVMLQCWQEDPNSRPSFKKLVTDLETMADSKEDQIYMRLLPSSEKYLYVNIHPELDDN